MISYTTELDVKQRINERLREAEQERLAKLATELPAEDRPSWRTKVSLAVARRFARAGGAA